MQDLQPTQTIHIRELYKLTDILVRKINNREGIYCFNSHLISSLSSHLNYWCLGTSKAATTELHIQSSVGIISIKIHVLNHVNIATSVAALLCQVPVSGTEEDLTHLLIGFTHLEVLVTHTIYLSKLEWLTKGTKSFKAKFGLVLPVLPPVFFVIICFVNG
jgi:hypothetical protein